MGFAVINRYRMIHNRIGVFWPEHSLQAGGRRFETCTAHHISPYGEKDFSATRDITARA